MSSFFNLILNPNFVFYYCIFIFVSVLAYGLYLLLKNRAIDEDIDKIDKHLRIVNDHDILHYDIDEDIGKRTPISEVWGLYSRQLIRQDATVGLNARTYYSTQTAHEFFNEENYVEVTVNMAAVRALPSFLTGLGILGTFLGLAAGIQTADQFTREGLMPLLNGAGLAFYTSIVGIACSLLATVSNKLVIHRINKKLTSLANRLDTSFPVMNRKDFDYQSLKMLQLCAKSISDIESGISDHHKEVSQRLESVLRSLVNEFTERLTVEIVSMGQLFNESVEGAAKEIRQSTDVFGQSINSVRDCLKEGVLAIDTSVKNATQNLDNSGSIMNEQLVEMTTQVSNTIKAVIEDNQAGLDAIEKMTNRLTMAAEDFEQRNDVWLKAANHSLLEVSQTLTNHFAEEGTKFADTMVAHTASLTEGVQSLLHQLDASTEKTVKAFDEMAERNDTWQKTANQSMLEASDGLNKQITAQGVIFAEKMAEQATALTEGVQALLQKLDDSSEKSAKTFDELTSIVAKASNEVLNVQSQLVDQSREVVASNAAMIAEDLKKQTALLAEGYRDELSKFSDRLEHSAVVVENANKDIASSILARMSEASEQIANQYKDLVHLSEDVGTKLKDLTSLEVEGRKQLDEKLVAIQSVTSTLNSINQVVVPIGESMKALQQMEGVLNRAASANESAGRSMAEASKEMKEHLDRVRETVGTTIDEADLKLANIVKLLNKTVQDWNDDQSRSAKKLLEAVDQIRLIKEERSGTLL